MSLTQIVQSAQTECFNNHGVFFAFSNEQLDQQKKEGVIYVSLGGGLICPKANVKAFVNDHANIISNGIKTDIEKNGKDAIIRRELDNHECFYTGDVEDCIDALDGYGFTREDIIAVYNKGE
jgi:hypothetical protein